jgi:ABC-2 type transport system ATP-binding protein
MIECGDIRKKFGDAVALDGVSFTAKSGELFGIVGPDGAGKSTLMRILATTLEPDGGRYAINGISISEDLFTAREKIAYMPQRFGLYEDLSVEENIFFFGNLFGVSNATVRKRLPRLYQFSRLEPFSARLAGKLSGGMKQKLGLVCALIHTPQILILDEPTNGVDPVSRREFWGILYELLAEGVAIILSTSYLDEAERCARIGLIDKGRFLTVDSPDAIKRSVRRQFFVIRCGSPDIIERKINKRFGKPGISRIGTTLRLFLPDNARETDLKKALTGVNDRIGIQKSVPSLEDCFLIMTGQTMPTRSGEEARS